MTHVLDRLVIHDFGRGNKFQEFIDLLPSAEMIVADNVWKFFEESRFVDRDGDTWNVHIDWRKDIPNIAPPFGIYFVGANSFPYNSFLGNGDYTSGGCLIVARDILDTQHEYVIAMISQYHESSRLALKRRGVRWVLYCVPFVIRGGWYVPPLFCQAILVGEDGDCVGSMESYDLEGIEELADGSGQDTEGIQHAYSDIAAFVVPPALLATCFCHCRNVELGEHSPPSKASRRREQKRGHALIKFRTIEIEPVKRILSEEGGLGSNGMGVALHICRGHFKDYREGRGLFGKHKDIYFWDMQRRGSAELGIVLKDYRASEPTHDPLHRP